MADYLIVCLIIIVAIVFILSIAVILSRVIYRRSLMASIVELYLFLTKKRFTDEQVLDGLKVLENEQKKKNSSA